MDPSWPTRVVRCRRSRDGSPQVPSWLVSCMPAVRGWADHPPPVCRLAAAKADLAGGLVLLGSVERQRDVVAREREQHDPEAEVTLHRWVAPPPTR